jgi:hypothetical protein
MRRAALVVVVALALTGSAAATSQPPYLGFHTLKSLPVIDLGRAYHQRTVSCSAHARQAKSRVGKVERKLAPVACEQPPRSHVRDAGSVIVLAVP